MRVYLDTSVLVALLTNDPSTSRADAYFRCQDPTPVVSDFVSAEFASALSRRVRMGEITNVEAHAAFAALDSWIVEVAERIETTAADIADAETFLRCFERPMPSTSPFAAVLRPRSSRSTRSWRLAPPVSESMGRRVRSIAPDLAFGEVLSALVLAGPQHRSVLKCFCAAQRTSPTS